MYPDEKALLAHLESPEFRHGVAMGKWQVKDQSGWPNVMIAVTATDRPNSPGEFYFKVNLQNYPLEAPTFMPWNPDTAQVLGNHLRPRGQRAEKMFRTDWPYNGRGGTALYAGYDREARQGHNVYEWDDRKTLAWALSQIYGVLNSDDYEGVC